MRCLSLPPTTYCYFSHFFETWGKTIAGDCSWEVSSANHADSCRSGNDARSDLSWRGVLCVAHTQWKLFQPSSSRYMKRDSALCPPAAQWRSENSARVSSVAEVGILWVQQWTESTRLTDLYTAHWCARGFPQSLHAIAGTILEIGPLWLPSSHFPIH
jgi:hypothetical protein